MKKEDAPFIHSDRDFAACSHWADCMKMVPFEASGDFYEQFNKQLEEAKPAAAA